MESPPPAVFHDKAKRTQQGDLLVMMAMMKRVGPSPPAGGAETLQSGRRCRQKRRLLLTIITIAMFIIAIITITMIIIVIIAISS